MTSYWIVSYLLHFLFNFHYVVISLVVNCTDEAMKAETRIQLPKLYHGTAVFLPSKSNKVSEDQVNSDSTPAIFDYLLQHKNIQQRLYA